MRRAGRIEEADAMRAKFTKRPQCPDIRSSVRDVWEWFLAVWDCRKDGINGLGSLDWVEAVEVLTTFKYARLEQLTQRTHTYLRVCVNELRLIEAERSKKEKTRRDRDSNKRRTRGGPRRQRRR